MPILAAFLGSLFASLAGFFAQFVTQKIAVALAVIAVTGTLTVATMAVIATAINTALASAGTLPVPVVLGFSFFWPSNFVLCFSLMLSAEAASALLRWNKENLAMAVSA